MMSGGKYFTYYEQYHKKEIEKQKEKDKKVVARG